MSASLGSFRESVDIALADLTERQVISRIWAGDHTVWKPEPKEITNRLGWLNSAEVMVENLERIHALVRAARDDAVIRRRGER